MLFNRRCSFHLTKFLRYYSSENHSAELKKSIDLIHSELQSFRNEVKTENAIAKAETKAEFAAMKADLSVFKNDIKAENTIFKEAIKAENTIFKTEIKSDLSIFKSETKESINKLEVQFDSLKDQIASEFKGLNHHMSGLVQRIIAVGTVIGGGAGFLTYYIRSAWQANPSSVQTQTGVSPSDDPQYCLKITEKVVAPEQFPQVQHGSQGCSINTSTSVPVAYDQIESNGGNTVNVPGRS